LAEKKGGGLYLTGHLLSSQAAASSGLRRSLLLDKGERRGLKKEGEMQMHGMGS
jgi:hypothetical protein